LFLHARSLRFQLADDAHPIEVTAPLDETLRHVLQHLDLSYE
jgi:hypothetical protein